MSNPIRIEAESLRLTGYRLESNSIASGGKLISLAGVKNNETGTATLNFSGPSDTYDIYVSYFDESDGQARLETKIGGKSVSTLVFNQNFDAKNISANNSVLGKLAAKQFVAQGTQFQFKGIENLQEHARIDYIEFRPVSTDPGSTPTPTPTPTPAPTPTPGTSGDLPSRDLGEVGTFHKWHKVEITLPGFASSATGTLNPFQTTVDVTFKGPGGTFTVPAFYDGDGKGGSTGNVWKVRFSANATGEWTFSTSSAAAQLDDYTGSFTVDPAPQSAPDLLRWGRLQYVGEHYLRFADGDYWIKGGIDDPENILGNAEGDFAAKRATIDYLSSRGVNSIYIMTNTIDGDGNDVWGWLGSTPTEAKANSRPNNTRFDIGKLQQWEDFFNYVQSRGMVLHIVLDDDGAWKSYDRNLYYRELIARFGHHPAIIWNIGEEAEQNYNNTQQSQYAAQLRSLDPYDHPVTVHREPGRNPWPFVGNSNFDLTSIEGEPDGASPISTTPLQNLNQAVIDNRNASASRGRPIAISIDETPKVDVVTEATRFKVRSEVLYPIYLGGGMYELHYGYRDIVRGTGTLSPNDLEVMWNDMRIARRFIEGLPFESMTPNNALLSNTSGNFALAKTGVAYGVYLKNGGSVNLNLQNVTGTYRVRWYNVTTGQYVSGDSIEGGDWRSLTSPFTGSDVAVAVTNIAVSSDTEASLPTIGTDTADTIAGDAIANVIRGLLGDDILLGAAGNDILDGGAGNDTLNGGVDFDTADYSQSEVGVAANLSTGVVQSGIDAAAETDTLIDIENVVGSAFNDTLIGGFSVNTIKGGAGNDLLSGNGGIDTFVYDAANEGIDTITDFGSDDFLQISAAGFGSGLAAGVGLNEKGATAGAFVSGVNPTALSDTAHLLYNTATGVISFDADGTGEGVPVAIAILQGNPTLDAKQILVGL